MYVLSVLNRLRTSRLNRKNSMHAKLIRYIFVSCCIVCATVSLCCAADAAGRAESKKIPTNIKADRMEYNADGQTVVFNGNVHVTRPDFELWSAKLTVYLDKAGKKSEETEIGGAGGMPAGDVDRIIAETDVRMKSNNNEASCQKATYYAKTDKVVMEGSPTLKDKDKNSITGTTITHYLKTNRSEVQNPKATFFTNDNAVAPGGKSKGKNNE